MKSVLLAILLVGVFVLSAGCNSLPAQPAGTTNPVPVNSVTTAPTDVIPVENAVTVSVAEKDPHLQYPGCNICRWERTGPG